MTLILLVMLLRLASAASVHKVDAEVLKSEELKKIAEAIENWRPEHGSYVWEHSGRFEGDINDPLTRNGLVSESARWPGGVVPYTIEAFGFTSDQIETIHKAVAEFNRLSCLKMRHKRSKDANYVHFVSSSSGCWSSVGMQGGEQKLNLQTPNCVRFGTVIHELLHAVGFYHQQSAANRDDYVRIGWENIKQGTEHNFSKYNSSVVTDFGLDYDYHSVMHYSGLAFSKNGQPTIEPKQENVTLGQREGFSESDLAKVGKMYGQLCEARTEEGDEEEEEKGWFYYWGHL